MFDVFDVKRQSGSGKMKEKKCVDREVKHLLLFLLAFVFFIVTRIPFWISGPKWTFVQVPPELALPCAHLEPHWKQW